jgi:ribosomal protein S25
MRSQYEQEEQVEAASQRELRLLTEVDEDPEVSQRELAKRVGIALGLTNMLVRNLAQKGYVRVTKAGWKRFIYTLTPAGVSRKLNLTIDYIQRFLGYYRTVRQNLREQLEPLGLNQESRIAIYGTGEFAELVYLGLKEFGIEEIDIFGPLESVDSKFLGMQVLGVGTLNQENYDKVVVAILGGTDAIQPLFFEQRIAQEKSVMLFQESPGRR